MCWSAAIRGRVVGWTLIVSSAKVLLSLNLTPIQIAAMLTQAMAAIFLYGLVALFDGVSIGSGDFRHLPRTNFLAMVTCVTALVTVRFSGIAAPD